MCVSALTRWCVPLPSHVQVGGPLLMGDVVVQVNGRDVRALSHQQLLQQLKQYSVQRSIKLSVFRSENHSFFVPPVRCVAGVQAAAVALFPPPHTAHRLAVFQNLRNRQAEDDSEVQPFGYNLNCSFVLPRVLSQDPTSKLRSLDSPLPGTHLVTRCFNAEFGAPLPWRKPVSMRVGLVSPRTGCRFGPATAAITAGVAPRKARTTDWWALVHRGDCFFHVKAKNAQTLGEESRARVHGVGYVM